jgi:hypothetical protein
LSANQQKDTRARRRRRRQAKVRTFPKCLPNRHAKTVAIISFNVVSFGFPQGEGFGKLVRGMVGCMRDQE